MFVRDFDSRSAVEVALDDFIQIGLMEDKEQIKDELMQAIRWTEEKLYWYKVLLAGMEEIE